jgi:hypothetical protein
MDGGSGWGLLVAAVGLAGMWLNVGCASGQPRGVTTIEHRGLEGAVGVTAGPAKLVVVPAWAGRMSVLDFGGGNVLWQDGGVDGKTLAADVPWMPWDGNATDLVRADGGMQWLELWLRPYPQVRLIEYGVELQSGPDGKAQLTATKRYELSADGRQMTYTATATNVGQEPAGWTVWERAQMLVPRYLIAPLDTRGPISGGWRLRSAAKEAPPALVQTHGDYLVLRPGSKEGVGLSVRLRAGWVGVVHEDGVVLIQYPIDGGGEYAHFGGGNFMPWIGERAIEVEPVSPQKMLKNGESVSLVQTWRWLELPKGVDVSNPQAVGAWVDGQAGKMGKP